VSTNASTGYNLQEEIYDPNGAMGRFISTTNGSNIIAGQYISAYSYSAPGVLASSPISGGFQDPGYMSLFNGSSPSAGSGDVFPLKWNFSPLGSTAPGTYTGEFGVLAAVN
jgi:hypothetical protein